MRTKLSLHFNPAPWKKTVVIFAVLWTFPGGMGALAQEKPLTEIKLTINGLDASSRKAAQFASPETVRLTAKDKFELVATYYPGIFGKNTPPVILLHDLNGQSDDLAELASYLQMNFGYAVLAPDLRGHGKSKKTGNVELDAAKFGREEFLALGLDIEAGKKFLVEKNDAGELNIDLLTIVAIGKASIASVNWSLNDWSYPTLAGHRQGQDVKALVLVSPEQSFKGVRMTNALKAPLFTGRDFKKPLRVLLAAGTDDRNLIKEVESIGADLSRHRTQNEDKTVDGVWTITDSYRANGAELTKAESGDLQLLIGQLVYLELYKKLDEYPWAEREKK